jgi:hypothetical protein
MPIPIEKLRAVTTIVAHDYCPDGAASALILKDVLPDAKVIFCQYNSPLHETLAAEPGMIFADFSPHQSRTQDFLDVGAIVLDHHKTQKETVEKFGENGVFGDESLDPGVSGAVLAYREVWQRLTNTDDFTVFGREFAEWVGEFARVAGVRDTWQKKSPDWERACEQSSSLLFVPQETLVRMGLREVWRNWDMQLGWAGKVAFAKHKKIVARAVREGYRHTTAKGHRVLLFQGSRLSSDAAEAPDAANIDIICGFDVIYEGRRVKYLYSCRSRSGFDVSALAKAYDGGGHKAAAGFNIPNPTCDPYRRFIEALQVFEEISGG